VHHVWCLPADDPTEIKNRLGIGRRDGVATLGVLEGPGDAIDAASKDVDSDPVLLGGAVGRERRHGDAMAPADELPTEVLDDSLFAADDWSV
jgi:hypothetical protein